MENRRILTSADALIEGGFVAPERREAIEAVTARYAVALPPALAALIDRSNPEDPIARQFLPDAREVVRTPEELDDPIGDHPKSPVPGLVHRYRDRALIKLVSVCVVYCRFCFRREMVGPGEPGLDEAAFAKALDYLKAHPEIREAIFTGGDPLALSPRRIGEVVAAIAGAPNIRVMRWHTRLPVAAPERVTEALARALTEGHDRAVYVAVHANHARELTSEARAAVRRLRLAGVTLVSQSVLLKGVNDDVDTLEALMRAFVETGIKPYYLHHPDLAPGTSHLRVTIEKGQRLMRELRRRLSGLAMPTYVLDIPGGRGKVPIGPGYVTRKGKGYLVADPGGEQVVYHDDIADS